MTDITEGVDTPETEGADSQRRGRPPKAKTVRMKRDPDQFPAPREADVHPDEVAAWKLHDWVEA